VTVPIAEREAGIAEFGARTPHISNCELAKKADQSFQKGVAC